MESQFMQELAAQLSTALGVAIGNSSREIISALKMMSEAQQDALMQTAMTNTGLTTRPISDYRQVFGKDVRGITSSIRAEERNYNNSPVVSLFGAVVTRSQAVQERERFIRNFVNRLEHSPVFSTLGRAVNSFARYLGLSGVSNIISGLSSGNILQIFGGVGELLVAAAIPLIQGALQHLFYIIGPQLMRDFLNATWNRLTGIFRWLGSALPQVWGNIIKGAQTLFTFIRYLYVTSGIPQFFARLGSTIMQTVRFFGALFGLANAVGLLAGSLSILGGVLGALGIGKGAELWSSGKKVQGGAAIGTGIISVIAGIVGLILIPISGPLALIAGGVALIAGAISAIIAYWDEIIGTVKRILKPITDWFGGRQKAKEEKQAAQAQKENTQLSAAPTASKEVVESIAKNGPLKPSNLTGHAEASRYGGNTVFGTRKSQAGEINWGKKDRADIIAGITSGKYSQLESLQGGGAGWKIDQGSFVNDVAAARAGTGAILSAVAAQMPGQNIVITSALGTKQSKKNKIHSGGDKGTGHYEGQTIDISAAGMTKAQAEDYAKRMYATGYFSHVAAERGKDGQYHLDARIADEAYKTFENATAESKKFEKDVDKAMKPSSTVVAPAPPGNNTLSYLKFGERSGEFGQRSLC